MMSDRYTNEKILELMKQRGISAEYYNRKIREEIEKEKAKYKFSWPRFLLLVGIIIITPVAFYLNHKLFPATSIWSWDYTGYWWF